MLYKARYYPVNKGRSNAGGIIHLRSADGFCEQNLTLTCKPKVTHYVILGWCIIL
jgi:hypothetical protein